MERGIYSLIHVPKTIYLPANIGILFEKKKEIKKKLSTGH
jgi:hypothetical protein